MGNSEEKITQSGVDIRDGLFLSPSRSYGEQYIEPFIRQILGLSHPDTGDYDAISDKGVKYEIKASKVLGKVNNSKKDKSLYERIIFEKSNLQTNRLVSVEVASSANYLANIQNVKRDHFEILLYVLLFKDCAMLFSLPKEKIGTGKLPSWSDKHGRYDAIGKSGQFPITKSTFSWHIENAFEQKISYDTMATVIKEISKSE